MVGNVIFEYDAEKSKWLRDCRGIGFEEIIDYIEDGWALAIIRHPNQKAHPGQQIYEVAVDGYVFEVPFYEHEKKHHLKTLYRSRKATKKHLDRGTLL